VRSRSVSFFQDAPGIDFQVVKQIEDPAVFGAHLKAYTLRRAPALQNLGNLKPVALPVQRPRSLGVLAARIALNRVGCLV
jgi:hypothetical protein